MTGRGWRRAAAATRPAPGGASARAAGTRRSTPPAWGPGTPPACGRRAAARGVARRAATWTSGRSGRRGNGAERTVPAADAVGPRVAVVVERSRVPVELMPKPALALEGVAVRVRMLEPEGPIAGSAPAGQGRSQARAACAPRGRGSGRMPGSSRCGAAGRPRAADRRPRWRRAGTAPPRRLRPVRRRGWPRRGPPRRRPRPGTRSRWPAPPAPPTPPGRTWASPSGWRACR